MDNNNMISLGELIDDCFNQYEVYIPLIQRNYKWDKHTATKLVSDLWNSYKKKKPIYTAGMITVYKEDNKKIQLIDGQQRIITLFMLLKILEPHKTDFKFKFERDEGIEKEEKKRFYYLENINKLCKKRRKIEDLYTDLKRFNENYTRIKNDYIRVRRQPFKEYILKNLHLYTDLERFKENYTSMKSRIKKEYKIVHRQPFKEYILKSLHFLLHISEIEPFDEFINLNKHKTRFVISDLIKANLIMDSSDEDKRKDILSLFKELSGILYYQSDDLESVWKLVNQGYVEEDIPEDNSQRYKNKLYSDENRLKLLCCERYGAGEYDGFSIVGYDKKIEYDTLVKYKNILIALEQDKNNKNWCSYNGFNITHVLLGKKFFSMLNEYADKDKNFKHIEEYLRHIVSQEHGENAFYISCFIESQLKNEYINAKDLIAIYKTVEDELNEAAGQGKELSERKRNWISGGVLEVEDYLKIYDAYIQNKYCLQEKNHENQ